MRRSRPVDLALVVLLSGASCLPTHTIPAPAPAPTATSEWPAVYARAMGEASEARRAAADQELVEFAERFPGSPEAAEVPYWRAVLRLASDSAASLRASMAMLESYLARDSVGGHRLEAMALHRLGLAVVQRNAAVAAAPTAATTAPDDKAREEELQRLRDELAKANAELDRIRRRLARPRP